MNIETLLFQILDFESESESTVYAPPRLRHQYLVCFTSARFTGVSWILSVRREYFSCLDTNTLLGWCIHISDFIMILRDSEPFLPISV